MFTLPELPYSFSALEPYIDAQTMEIHHDKHHAAYIKNLNDLVSGETDLMKLVRHDSPKIRNNAGGHYNHSLFWTFMSPNPSNSPNVFSSLKTDFTAAALSIFGSGWAWIVEKDGKPGIVTTPNQDVPDGKILLGLDVWEHAYYLKYQNRRVEYVERWWNVVNWNVVADRFSSSQVY